LFEINKFKRMGERVVYEVWAEGWVEERARAGV
jgi:hypothetical protein